MPGAARRAPAANPKTNSLTAGTFIPPTTPTTSPPGRRCSSFPASQPARYAASLVRKTTPWMFRGGRWDVAPRAVDQRRRERRGGASPRPRQIGRSEVEAERQDRTRTAGGRSARGSRRAPGFLERRVMIRPVTPVRRMASRIPSHNSSVPRAGHPPPLWRTKTTRGLAAVSFAVAAPAVSAATATNPAPRHAIRKREPRIGAT